MRKALVSSVNIPVPLARDQLLIAFSVLRAILEKDGNVETIGTPAL